jgi:pentatricopeptide repeat protein
MNTRVKMNTQPLYSTENITSLDRDILIRVRQIHQMDAFRKFINNLTTIILSKNITPGICVYDLLNRKLLYLTDASLNGKTDEFHVAPKQMFVTLMNRSISSCFNSKDVDKAMQLFDKMQNEYKLVPDIATYGIIVKGLLQNGKPRNSVQSTNKILSQMKQRSIPMNDIIYNQLLRFYCKFKALKDPLQFVEEMSNDDPPVLPDLISYNILLMDLAKQKNTETMQVLFSQMRERNINPDNHTFFTVLVAYLEQDDFTQAVNWFNSIRNSNNGLQPSEKLFHLFIEKYVQKGDMANAIQWLRKMDRKADVTAYTTVIKGLLASNQQAKAKSFFDEMKALGLHSRELEQKMINLKQ